MKAPQSNWAPDANRNSAWLQAQQGAGFTSIVEGGVESGAGSGSHRQSASAGNSNTSSGWNQPYEGVEAL
jgi:hypothetical protein